MPVTKASRRRASLMRVVHIARNSADNATAQVLSRHAESAMLTYNESAQRTVNKRVRLSIPRFRIQQ